ncbi:MAG: alpha/beta hydrolase-fold protein [Actinomycetes bacterium]
MEIVERFQIRNLEGEVYRCSFGERRVDFWSPLLHGRPSEHLIVTHDGQNIFDKRTATRRRTWKLAQTASRISQELGIPTPTIIAVFHGGSKENAWGRAHDLAPQRPFQTGIIVAQEKYRVVKLEDLQSDAYLEAITTVIAPDICEFIGLKASPEKTALWGSSMGGLATLYGIGRHPEIFSAGFAFSPHWVIGENALVDSLLDALPKPGSHKIWMSRGTKALDGQYQPFQDYADRKMIQLGWQPENDFISRVFPKDRHNEPSWARQSAQALNFWLA